MALLFQGGMGLQIFPGRDAPGEHGLGLDPIFLDQHGKIEVNDEAGRQRGCKEAVEEAVVIDKIPTQTEKGEGKKIP